MIRVISSFQGLSLGLADATNWTLENTSQGHKVMFSWNKLCENKVLEQKDIRIPSTSYKYLSLFICLLMTLSLDLILKHLVKTSLES